MKNGNLITNFNNVFSSNKNFKHHEIDSKMTLKKNVAPKLSVSRCFKILNNFFSADVFFTVFSTSKAK